MVLGEIFEVRNKDFKVASGEFKPDKNNFQVQEKTQKFENTRSSSKDLFRTHNNYITIRDRKQPENSKKTLLLNHGQLERILDTQRPDTDIYINKYPSDKLIDTIILDFDSEDDLQRALNDVADCALLVEENKLDTAIIESGSKGYHLYIRIPLTDFKGYGSPNKTKNVFNKFIDNIIGGAEKYPTLDKINFSSGLKGNIRVVGSTHPTTGKKCRLLETYNGWELNRDYIDESLQEAEIYAEEKESERKEQLNNIRILQAEYNSDYIKDNDLRELLPQIFGGDIRHFTHYSMMRCPFHPDNHPSLMVGKEWFKCKGCGTKGNIWYLIKHGYLNRNNL